MDLLNSGFMEVDKLFMESLCHAMNCIYLVSRNTHEHSFSPNFTFMPLSLRFEYVMMVRSVCCVPIMSMESQRYKGTIG